MNAAVLLRNSGRSGTCSQRITAPASSRASVCFSSNVPSAAYTSIIGIAGPPFGDFELRSSLEARELACVIRLLLIAGNSRSGGAQLPARDDLEVSDNAPAAPREAR